MSEAQNAAAREAAEKYAADMTGVKRPTYQTDPEAGLRWNDYRSAHLHGSDWALAWQAEHQARERAADVEQAAADGWQRYTALQRYKTLSDAYRTGFETGAAWGAQAEQQTREQAEPPRDEMDEYRKNDAAWQAREREAAVGMAAVLKRATEEWPEAWALQEAVEHSADQPTYFEMVQRVEREYSERQAHYNAIQQAFVEGQRSVFAWFSTQDEHARTPDELWAAFESRLQGAAAFHITPEEAERPSSAHERGARDRDARFNT